MSASFAPAFAEDLRTQLELGLEAMSLAVKESQALSGQSTYEPFKFYQTRKNLLPRLEQSLMALRKWRVRWQQADPAERASCSEVQALFQSVQSLLMKVLLLDRENQQVLLRRGLLSPRQLPASAAQQPHFAADAYRRHSRA